MKITDRLRRIEAASAVAADRRRQIESDAADFLDMVNRLAARSAHLPRTTEAEFRDAVRCSGDPFLIDLFAKEDSHARC